MRRTLLPLAILTLFAWIVIFVIAASIASMVRAEERRTERVDAKPLVARPWRPGTTCEAYPGYVERYAEWREACADEPTITAR